MYIFIQTISVVLFLNTLVLLGLSVNAFLRKKYKGAVQFACFLIAASIWSFAVAMESTSLTLEMRILWSQISYLGIVSVAPLWLAFALIYSERKNNIFLKKWWVLYIFPAITLALVFTNSSHKLIWPDFHPINNDVINGVIYDHGTWFYLNTLYIYVLFFYGYYMLIKHALKSTSSERKLLLMILGGIALPWIANIAYVLSNTLVLGGIELTPVAMSIAAIFISYGMLRQRFLSIVPVARKEAFANLGVAVLVIDLKNDIIDFNDKAEEINGEKIYIGSSINSLESSISGELYELLSSENKVSEVFIQRMGRWFRMNVNPVKNEQGLAVAHTVVMADTTNLKNIQLETENSNVLLKAIINFLPDPTFVINNRNKVIIWNDALAQFTGFTSEQMRGSEAEEYNEVIYKNKRLSLANIVLEHEIYPDKKWDNVTWNGSIASELVEINEEGKEPIKIITSAKVLYGEDNEAIAAVQILKIAKSKSSATE